MISVPGTVLMGQGMKLHQLVMCTGDCLTMRSRVEQSSLCFAGLEYIHSLIEAREEKRGKKCEKEEGGETYCS